MCLSFVIDYISEFLFSLQLFWVVWEMVFKLAPMSHCYRQPGVSVIYKSFLVFFSQLTGRCFFTIFICFYCKIRPFDAIFYVCVTCCQSVFLPQSVILLQNKSITCCWCTVRLFHLINNINIAVLLVIRLDMRWQESWLFVLSAERECWHDTVSWRWLMLSDMNPSRDGRGLSQVCVWDHVQAGKKESDIFSLSLFFFCLFT